ncbi:uncharacterized protein PAC_07928 [Phialocephala subalpina]|uniref:Uncharacterized protein n=1 Tax=Phialocephala subalpina TaxID=576137 RepID=A0A1L7WZ36_9HELO|nr:uncharacterized protein PAC_07928 [Phialocephala subalpina]
MSSYPSTKIVRHDCEIKPLSTISSLNHSNTSTFNNLQSSAAAPQFNASLSQAVEHVPSNVNSCSPAATERQKLSSDCIATYLANPVGTLPQYKYNTYQASIQNHIDTLKVNLGLLSAMIDNHEG